MKRDRLEMDIDAHLEEQWREREARGDFGAEAEARHATELVERATHTDDLRRAEVIFNNVGVLAAKEAFFEGIEIDGWDGELSYYADLPSIESDRRGKKSWPINQHLRHVDRLPDRFQILANLADNPLLREIRQTGSPLIPKDREVRFAKARVEKANNRLKKEEKILAKFEEELSEQQG